MSNETEKKVKKISIKQITLAALFAALVTVATTVVKSRQVSTTDTSISAIR